jgi:hypothetical protein
VRINIRGAGKSHITYKCSWRGPIRFDKKRPFEGEHGNVVINSHIINYHIVKMLEV